jgi:hypothetical protein
MFVAWWSDDHEIETARTLGELEAMQVVEDLKPGVRWTVYKREHSWWKVRAVRTTERYSIDTY